MVQSLVLGSVQSQVYSSPQHTNTGVQCAPTHTPPRITTTLLHICMYVNLDEQHTSTSSSQHHIQHTPAIYIRQAILTACPTNLFTQSAASQPVHQVSSKPTCEPPTPQRAKSERDPTYITSTNTPPPPMELAP